MNLLPPRSTPSHANARATWYLTANQLTPINPLARGGIQILQLHLPYRAGYVHVTRNVKQGQKVWRLQTENIRRFGFIYFAGLEQPTDGTLLNDTKCHVLELIWI